MYTTPCNSTFWREQHTPTNSQPKTMGKVNGDLCCVLQKKVDIYTCTPPPRGMPCGGRNERNDKVNGPIVYEGEIFQPQVTINVSIVVLNVTAGAS